MKHLRPVVLWTTTLSALIAVPALALHEDTGAARATASDPSTVNVKVADLVPRYHGTQATTWREVERLRDRGEAQIIQLYADNTGNYAFVFDTGAEFTNWACAQGSNKRTLCADARRLSARRPSADTSK
jgi:hypothetical protein